MSEAPATLAQSRPARVRYAEYYLELCKEANADRPISGEDLAQARNAWQWVSTQPDLTLLRAYVEHVTPQLERRGLRREVLEWRQRDLSAARELGDDTEQLFSLLNVGRAYEEVGIPQQAIACYLEALPLAEQGVNQRAQGLILGMLGSAYQSVGDYTRAGQYFEQALAHGRQLRHEPSETVWGSILGNTLLNRLKDIRQAMLRYQEALARAVDTNDQVTQVSLWCDLAQAHISAGDLAQAQQAFEQAVSLAATIGYHAGEARALSGLAALAEIRANGDAALAYREKMIQAADRISDRAQRLLFFGTAGLAFAEVSAWPHALELHERQVVLARELADVHGEGLALAYRGQALHALGRRTEAEHDYKAAVAIMQQVGDKHIEGRTLLGLARLYDEMNRSDEATRYYSAASEIARSLDDRGLLREIDLFMGQATGCLPIVEEVNKSDKLYPDVNPGWLAKPPASCGPMREGFKSGAELPPHSKVKGSYPEEKWRG